MRILKKLAIALVVILLVGGGVLWWMTRPVPATVSLEDTTGTDPVLVEPDEQVFPTVGVAKPIGWGADGTPDAAQGLQVTRFAEGLEHPRVLYTLPNGDVLVTLSNAPERPLAGGFLTNLVAGFLFSAAGADVPSPNKLVLLRDADKDGRAEAQFVLRDDLDSPSGIAWGDGKLYVANHDEVLRFNFEPGATSLPGEPTKLMDLPPAGNHWMRNILLSEDGTSLFIAVGSASNIAEGGLDAEIDRAAIHELDLTTGRARQWAAGLRNPNGLAWSPWSGELWTTVNERDMLGSDLVPDYFTNVPLGAQYGWPWTYYGSHYDERVQLPQPQFLEQYTREPEFAMGAHVAALGVVFTQAGSRLGAPFQQGAFIARHGSWNRRPLGGYDVVYVAFDDLGNPVGKPVPVLNSFLASEDETRGRPTWLAWDQTGALLVSDDTGNIIWRVINPAAQPTVAHARNSGTSLPPQRELNGDPARAFDEVPEEVMQQLLENQ
ncbi:PQQ-dependent sugar dehydrogenase [Alteraurantiacibacter buctensis]|uniref:Sorbosone dehydrogenase family protein n=1 Tax=Alteraurantiacibacter buctensis TaxID=1503981 RepID=A0A844YU16_9SPHN|nr:PQQ-dependent sugar dehydrogenase [Alteraurantiacibacter buctensis]MXO70530.1 sorbosone dehydrogenase family protein [Alteraurantiacibacter buctensis]